MLISPCRDEAQYMRETLDSVISQSVRPQKWIIVDDGSTDETPKILAVYQKKHDWIDVVTRGDRGRRSVGPGVIEAFYAGYEAINPDDYKYLCKLDLDLRLPPRYFEILMQRIGADPRIATCSGKTYVAQDGRLVEEGHGDDMSLSMTKFYRVSRFKAIGGFVREVMRDGIDCHRCRMNGCTANRRPRMTKEESLSTYSSPFHHLSGDSHIKFSLRAWAIKAAKSTMRGRK